MENINNNIEDNDHQSALQSPVRHHRNQKEKGKFFVVFIIGAIVGMLVYFFINEEVGIVIVLGAMAFKMCECVIRLVK